MAKNMDLTGVRFGRLIVLSKESDSLVRNGRKTKRWKCRCDCGNEIVTNERTLKDGRTKSCGCLQKERARDANFQDITFQKFGKLTAIKCLGKSKTTSGNDTYWLCKCECGNFAKTTITKLKSGHTRSCGCLKKRNESDNYIAKSKTRLYRIWIGMKTRCFNVKAGNYKYYGAKGVTICKEWVGDDGFENFKKWSLENGYKDGLTIDRIDNEKEYSPDNCRWVTMKEQARNTSQVKMIEYNGENKSVPDWAESIGISAELLKKRIRDGWSIEKCIKSYYEP